MKKSDIILYSDDGAVIDSIRLTGEASEWLFSTGFWNDVNDANGTIFDQYEEDDANVAVLISIVDILSRLIVSVSNSINEEFNFTYGFDKNKKRLYLKVKKSDILVELAKFKYICEEAIRMGKTLIFYL